MKPEDIKEASGDHVARYEVLSMVPGPSSNGSRALLAWGPGFDKPKEQPGNRLIARSGHPLCL